MKCDTCKNRKYHPGGSFYAVAEGGDDPYNYEYCNKGHWCGVPDEPQCEEAVGMEDQFINCSDYREI
jgi:hypothetical protein